MKALPKGTKRLVAEEPLPFTGHDEANFIDGVISTCYRLVGSFEQEIRIDQVAGCVPRGTLGEIADKAFASGMEYKGFDLYSASANSGHTP